MTSRERASFAVDIGAILLLGIVYVAGLTAKTLGSHVARSWAALTDQLDWRSVEGSPRR